MRGIPVPKALANALVDVEYLVSVARAGHRVDVPYHLHLYLLGTSQQPVTCCSLSELLACAQKM